MTSNNARTAESLPRARLSDLWRLAAALLLAVLFVTNVYRAATQSISHDEGTMFEWFLSGSWGQVLNFEHGNHHVLTDLLAKLMITVFGASAFTLRIPSLLGGLLYFCAIFRLSRLLFGEAFVFLLSVALLSLNPFVLDYLSCSRGYGLALGLFFYALYQVILYLNDWPERPDSTGSKRLFRKAGIALGLSIGANPIMIFPGGALLGSFFVMLLGDRLVRRSERANTRQSIQPWRQALLHLALPASAVGVFVLTLPKQLIELEAGNMGPSSLFAILQPLVRFSFVHSPAGYRGLAVWFPAEAAIGMVTYLVVPGCLVALVLAAGRIAFHWMRKRSLSALTTIDRSLMLLGILLPATIALIVISRYLFHQPYPELRTAMYWLPLLELAAVVLLDRLSQGSRIEWILSVPLAAVLLLCVVQFATQFNTRYFAEWAYCSAGKDMMQIVRSDHAATPGARARIGASWQLEPVINFYRLTWHLDWMDPVNRESPANAYDYYLLGFGDTPLVESLHLKQLDSDRLSGTVLAKRVTS